MSKLIDQLREKSAGQVATVGVAKEKRGLELAGLVAESRQREEAEKKARRRCASRASRHCRGRRVLFRTAGDRPRLQEPLKLRLAPELGSYEG